MYNKIIEAHEINARGTTKIQANSHNTLLRIELINHYWAGPSNSLNIRDEYAHDMVLMPLSQNSTILATPFLNLNSNHYCQDCIRYIKKIIR